MRRRRRQVDELRANARSSEAVLAALPQLQYGGLVQANSAEEAERIMTELAQSMEGCSVVGIQEEIISLTIAIIWLWRDAWPRAVADLALRGKWKQ